MATVKPLALITTKLHRPRVPDDLVPRPRLVEQLNRGLSGPLTLVCAPAGFGKTTLISSWIEDRLAGEDWATPSPPVAWLALDESDSDLILFERYFIAAIRTVFADACATTLDLLQAPKQPPLAHVLTVLSNELARLPKPLVLVLDDYHSIGSTAVHDFLSRLIRHWPRTMHLVLIARSTPPLPLASLRAKGLVSEIRSRDLRFTPEESAVFLNAVLPAPLHQSTVALLEQRTEGWIAGLRLATLSLHTEDEVTAALESLSSANTDIAGYLVDEVLSRQPPAIQMFLLKTAILDQFCASVCEAVVGSDDSEFTASICMEWIERANLFIIPLDNHNEWYRYHHLFQELLQRRLKAVMGPEQICDLHCRAVDWLAQHGRVEEALQHALAANDLDLAARLMGQGLCDVLNREDRPTLERWLRLLPDEFIERRPGTLMIKAWALELSWQLNAQSKVLKQVEALIAKDDGTVLAADELKIVRGQLLNLYGQAAFFRNECTRAIAFYQESLPLLPSSWRYVRGGSMMFLGLSMQASGHGLAAEGLLLDQYESLGDKTTVYAVRLLMALCLIYLQSGQLEQVRQTAEVMLPLATEGGLVILRCWAHYFLGIVHYQQNDLDEARQHFDVVIQSRHTTQALAVSGSLFGLVLTQQARGENAEARKAVTLLSQFDLQLRGAEEDRTRSLRARLMLLQGDLEHASRWADAFMSQPPDQPLLWLEESHLTKARILLARDKDCDVQSALHILDALYEIAQRTFNIRFQIEILALRALALDMQGQTGDALTTLQQAVKLSRPGGFIRVFVDLGPRMQIMLLRLAGQGFAVETIRRILAAFPASVTAIETRASESDTRTASPRFIEALSRRELDVLALLRERLSNKEIAHQLGLSSSTVKRYTVNLYEKLDVNRRWDAVIKAEALGILPPR